MWGSALSAYLESAFAINGMRGNPLPREARPIVVEALSAVANP